MKISYNWLKDFLPDLAASPEEVAEALTMHAYETQIHTRWAIDPGVRVVSITKIEPHPNADRLRLATVTDGHAEIRVVCGAPNISVGDVVPYSLPGTKVLDAEGSVFTLKEATIRGEKSPGMLNSPRELGIGDSHSGILLLPPDTPLGSALIDHLPNDTILEADITPNRAHDSLSHRGVAREVAALLRLTLKEQPHVTLPAPQNHVEGFTLDIEHSQGVPRYMGLVMREAQNNSVTPLWIQRRLLAMGVHSISPLVDITNFVMFEVGNPSHVFDVANLPDKIIGVRQVEGGSMLFIDQQTRKIPSNSLAITSGDGPIALAGIMGGAKTQVGRDTAAVFLEIANFHAYTIQKTAAALNLRTEASSRFAKGLDPNLVQEAAARAVYLMQQITGAKLAGVLDAYPSPRLAPCIHFSPERVSVLAGTHIPTTEAKDILRRLRCRVDDTSIPWLIYPSTDRLDIAEERDVIEEIVRMYGLEKIPATPLLPKAPQPFLASLYWPEVIRTLLVQLGCTETYAYTFEPQMYASYLHMADAEHLEVTNPVAPELARLRQSLLPGLLAHVAVNKEEFHRGRRRMERALFEIGAIMKPGPGSRVPGVIEERHVASVLVGSSKSSQELVDAILERMSIEGVSYEKTPWPWAKEACLIKHAGVTIGITAELSPTLLKKIKYRLPVVLFELNTEALVKHAKDEQHIPTALKDLAKQPSPAAQYEEFSRYPSVLRDISLLVENDVPPDQVQEIIERVGGKLVANTELFDEYQPSDDAQKGLAFHIEYQAADHTLTDEEVNQLHGHIILALESEINAEIR